MGEPKKATHRRARDRLRETLVAADGRPAAPTFAPDTTQLGSWLEGRQFERDAIVGDQPNAPSTV